MVRSEPLGAYGFRLVLDADATVEDMVPVDASAEPVRFSWRRASANATLRHVTAERIYLSGRGAVTMDIRREPRAVTLDIPYDIDGGAVLHPLATSPLSILARWRGDIALHGGAVMIGDAAFGVFGDRTAGKSTMLALLSRRELPIVADDLLVVRGGEALAGPACVDLRPDVAARFPDARDLGEVGQRRRYRLSTLPAPPRLPLRGVFLLDWSDDGRIAVSELGVAEKLRLVHGQEYAAIAGLPAPEQVFNLVELPMWRVRRPRDWRLAEASLDCVLETAAAAPDAQ